MRVLALCVIFFLLLDVFLATPTSPVTPAKLRRRKTTTPPPPTPPMRNMANAKPRANYEAFFTRVKEYVSEQAVLAHEEEAKNRGMGSFVEIQ